RGENIEEMEGEGHVAVQRLLDGEGSRGHRPVIGKARVVPLGEQLCDVARGSERRLLQDEQPVVVQEVVPRGGQVERHHPREQGESEEKRRLSKLAAHCGVASYAPMDLSRRRWWVLGILCVAVAAVFAQTAGF